jgi:3',5'-cyclic AMP phosphodiesterase CpdA
MSIRNSLVLAIILGLVVIGIGYAETENVSMTETTTEEAAVEATPVEAAIAEADMLITTPEKVSYLLEKANAFYTSEQFQEAVDVAQYVLDSLDAESQEAKDLVAKAKEALAGMVTEKIEDTAAAVQDTTEGVTEKTEM